MTASSHRFFSIVIAAGCVATLACSSGPSAPTAGSPAYQWNAAAETFRNGDYVKTGNNLAKLVKSNDYASKAQPWEMVLHAGMAQGYMELADRYEAGGRANKGAAPGFRAQVSHYRSTANGHELQLAESFHAFMQKNKDDQVTLAFPFPSGSTNEPAQVVRVANGVLPGTAENASIEKAMLQRGMLLAVANAAGAPNDPAKAREVFRSGEVKLSRADFMRAMARALHDGTQLYIPTKMDHPQRLKLLCNEAKQALAGLKETNKEDVALRKKIDDTMKKYKLSS